MFPLVKPITPPKYVTCRLRYKTPSCTAKYVTYSNYVRSGHVRGRKEDSSGREPQGQP